jgi:hypothetical protein
VAEATPGEQWLPIPGRDGYEVSDLGSVRSLDRIILRRDGTTQRCRGQVLRTWDEHGYLHVRLGTGPHYFVHRLVLMAFVGRCPDGQEGLHKNGDAGDARLVNLRWGTPSENARDRIRHGTCAMTQKTHCPQGHPLAGDNLHPGDLRRGLRACAACFRARSRIRWHRARGFVLPDYQGLSDQFYLLISRGLIPAAPGRTGRQPRAVEERISHLLGEVAREVRRCERA